jgi:hypothetical protein
MTARMGSRLTWARVGIAFSIGLVVFGVVDASLPHSTHPSAITPSYPVSRLGPEARPNAHVATARSKSGTAMPLRFVPFQAQVDAAAQSVAERFVVATDTTDPTHPEGDLAERALLAPGLTMPRQIAWPEAWVADDRRTTVVLDPPGAAVGVGAGQVTVVLTGRMSVTTVAGPSTEVPVDERVTLHLIKQQLIGPAGSVPHWVVTNVGTGS